MMTLTEKNQKLYELRKKLNEARLKVEFYELQIAKVNEEYKWQDLDLFMEMGLSETPLGDEMFGG